GEEAAEQAKLWSVTSGKHGTPSRKPCASIDALLRDWDVLLVPPPRQIKTPRAESKLLGGLLAVLRGKNSMGRTVVACALLCGFLLSPAFSAETRKPIETIPVSQIRVGMRGV